MAHIISRISALNYEMPYINRLVFEARIQNLRALYDVHERVSGYYQALRRDTEEHGNVDYVPSTPYPEVRLISALRAQEETDRKLYDLLEIQAKSRLRKQAEEESALQDDGSERGMGSTSSEHTSNETNDYNLSFTFYENRDETLRHYQAMRDLMAFLSEPGSRPATYNELEQIAEAIGHIIVSAEHEQSNDSESSSGSGSGTHVGDAASNISAFDVWRLIQAARTGVHEFEDLSFPSMFFKTSESTEN